MEGIGSARGRWQVSTADGSVLLVDTIAGRLCVLPGNEHLLVSVNLCAVGTPASFTVRDATGVDHCDEGSCRECDVIERVNLALGGGHAPESTATADVLAERAKQIAKGYTPEHDDHHTPSEPLAYGGITWADPTREQLVRGAACVIAAIERMDRIAMPSEDAR